MTPADRAGEGGRAGQELDGRDAEVRPGQPAGQVYDWFVRGRTLLEVLARALFDAHRHREAAEEFANLADVSPDDDDARFGLGLSRWRLGDLDAAVEQLTLAAAMRPDRREYEQALRQVRATLRARQATEDGSGSPDAG